MSTIDETIAASLLPRAFEPEGTGQELFLQIHNTLSAGNTPTPSQLKYLQQAFSRVVTQELELKEAFGLLGKAGNRKPLFSKFWDFSDADIRDFRLCVRYELAGRKEIKGLTRDEIIADEFSVKARQTIYNIRKKQHEFDSWLVNASDSALRELIDELNKIVK